ncbi:MAG TPA: cupin domain-containing protein [Rhodothermia bacterium]|nr:cupin domain-containing protein [Rhodothermia bacterium]
MKWLTLLIAGLFFCCLHSPPMPPTPQSSPTVQGVSIGEILSKMAEAYRHKVVAGASERVQIDIQPELESGFVDRERPALESWNVTVTPDRQVIVRPGPARDLTYIVFTTRTGLRAMYEGRFNVMTSQLRARSSDPSYIEYTRAPGIELTPAVSARIRHFIHFFDTSVPHRYVLSQDHARLVHGAAVVGLYYYPGLRSAWYEVRKGMRLNEPGDTNPSDQAFIFVSGNGMAKIGDRTIRVKAGESYYIPPGSDHVVWTESDEPVQLIWMAWGQGA